MRRGEGARIIYIPVDELSANPEQPRRRFEPEALERLAASITEYGVITPLTVRRTGRGWELVAGERRLRAARMAGLAKVPCVALEVDSEGSALVALVENLQREDLDFVEEAEGIAKLIDTWGMTQEEAARRLGKSQSAIANKLRVLHLPEGVLDDLRASGLTERHARALLRLPDDGQRVGALRRIIENRMNVARTEEYIEGLRAEDAPRSEPDDPKQEIQPDRTEQGKKKNAPRIVVRDVRLFLNTVNRGAGLLRDSGLAASVRREDREDETVITITIPKKK